MATTLTDTQKQEVINSGFPSNYVSWIQPFYNDWESGQSGAFSVIFSAFKVFAGYVSDLSNLSQTSLAALSNVCKLTRALYVEVSDHSSNEVMSLSGISDGILNRVGKRTDWSNYYKAASNEGLDLINPSSSVYLAGSVFKNPVADACSTASHRQALIKAYRVATSRLNDNDTTKYTTLASSRVYFRDVQPTKTTNYTRLGNFYFADTNTAW